MSRLIFSYGQTTFEAGTWLKSENLIELQFPNELIDRRLPVLALNFRQDQLGGIAVVEAAEVGLHLEQLARAVECHLLALYLIPISNSITA